MDLSSNLNYDPRAIVKRKLQAISFKYGYFILSIFINNTQKIFYARQKMS